MDIVTEIGQIEKQAISCVRLGRVSNAKKIDEKVIFTKYAIGWTHTHARD